jgi:hypothetical protein
MYLTPSPLMGRGGLGPGGWGEGVDKQKDQTS